MSVSFLGAQAAESGTVSSSRPVISVGSTTTANAKGAYLPLIAATAYPAAWIQIECPRVSDARDYLVDIAVGAASSEQVIIASLPYSANSVTSAPAAAWLFPLFIPAGSRISCRNQNTVGTSQTIDVQVTCFAPMFGSERGLGQVEACGANTGTSLGTSVDPGGSANTKGTPVQLIAATSFAYKWVCVSINHTNILSSVTSWTVDIMVGAGGSEVVVAPDLSVACADVADTVAAIGICFPLSIPAGSRVSARAQCSSTTATNRLLEVVVHGVG